MKKLLAALAVVAGVILVTSTKGKTPEPVYTAHEDEGGDWWLLEDGAFVCGPLNLEMDVWDAARRWKSTRHC